MSARFLTLLVAPLALALALPAHAQYRAGPRSADDIDVSPTVPKKPVKEEPPPAVEEPGPANGGEEEEETYVPGRPSRPKKQQQEEQGPSPVRTATAPPAADAGISARVVPDAGVSADAGAAAPAAAGGDDAKKDAVKPLILPPADGDARLTAAWAARHKAVLARNMREVLEQEKQIVRLRDELGYDDLFGIGAALAREAEALASSDEAEAARRAMLAAALAPDLPAAHWAVVRTAFREDLTNFGRYAGSTVLALEATWREPRSRSALLGEIAVMLLGAFLLAAAAAIGLVFLRHVRCFLHDFHHLFPAGAWRFQTLLVALLLLALPVLFSLGPVAFLAGLALATWLHMDRGERVVVGLLFVLAGLAPLAVTQVERFATFAGTRAESVYLLEKGGPDAAPPGLEQRMAARADGRFEILFALGRRDRLRGSVAEALVHLRQAAELRSSSEPALIELGNALFLQDDLDGARETYQRVLHLRESSAAAHYNLARLFDRRAQLVSREEAAGQLADAQRHGHRVIDLDPVLGAKLAGEPDLHANRFLAGAALTADELAALAAGEARSGGAGDDLAARLFGPLPPSFAWAAGLAITALLALFGLLGGVAVPSAPCHKCGRPVCRRCDAEVVGPGLCGQCITVFAQRGAVDPPARAAKERQIKLFQRHKMWATRFGALVLPGGGQLLSGRAGSGLALAFTAAICAWGIVFPGGLVPAPWGQTPAAIKLAPCALTLALIWLLSARRVFRQTAAHNLLKTGTSTPPVEAQKPEAGTVRA